MFYQIKIWLKGKIKLCGCAFILILEKIGYALPGTLKYGLIWRNDHLTMFVYALSKHKQNPYLKEIPKFSSEFDG